MQDTIHTPKKKNQILLAVFIIGIAISAVGYFMGGTENVPTSPTMQSLGNLVSSLGGLVLFVWICLAIAKTFRKSWNKKDND